MSSRSSKVIELEAPKKKDCMLCTKYVDCGDKRKTIGFYCSKFSRNKGRDQEFIGKLFDTEAFDNPIADDLGLDYEKVELDLVAMVKDAIDPNTQLPRDLKIDDRDIPEFPNYFNFVMAKDGMDLKPFSRQAYLLAELFNEICPKCTDPKIKSIMDVPVDLRASDLPERIQFLNFGKCPKCKGTRLDFLKKGKRMRYQELAALVGQRSGKSTMMVAPAVVYLLHRMLKMQKPYEMYGLNPTTLVGTLVAQTFQNSYEQLWLPVKTYIENSQWFTNYHDMLKVYENKYDEELVKFQSQGLHYLHRQVMLYPQGPNRKLLRGKTRWLSAIDEWDFFDNDDDSEQVRMNGQEVYASLNNSMFSVRVGWKTQMKKGYYNIPNAYFLTASSPQHARGVLVKHVNEHLNSKRILAVHLPTWHVHPIMTKRLLAKEFASDPAKLERDFGANPPLTDSGFIDDIEAIVAMCNKNLTNRIDIAWTHKEGSRGVLRAAEITACRLPGVIEPSIMALDAGETANSFAIKIGHRNPNKLDKKKIIVDIMLEIMPEKGKVSLSHSRIYKQIISILIQRFNVSAVLADRWQSIKMLQDIEEEFKIFAGVYSLKYRDMVLVKNHILENTIEIPAASRPMDEIIRDEGKYPESFQYRPVDHFLLQCATIKDTGKEVVKGTKLTDDLWRAFALGVTFLLNDEFCKKHLKNRLRRKIEGGLVAAHMMSQGGTNSYGNAGLLATPRSVAAGVTRIAAASGGTGGSIVTGLGVFARQR